MGRIQEVVKTAAEAAGLVFLHAAFENAVFDLLKRLVWYDPEAWANRIKDMKVSFAKLRAMDASKLRDMLLKKWLEKIEKQSFPQKVQQVLGYLQPESTRGVIQGFDFDLQEFRKIDELRHEITHRPEWHLNHASSFAAGGNCYLQRRATLG